MNRLTYIIDLIDTEVAAKLAYKDVSANGIVRREPKAGQTIIYKYKGEAIVFNDVPGISTYHRVIDVSEVRNLDSGYGSELLKEQTYRMRYVMYGDQTRVNDICDDYNYQLADEVGGFIPNTFSSVNTAAIEAKSVVINISRTDYDRVRVFRDELPDNEFNLSDTDILFAIEYDLTIRYLAQCTTVDCDPVYPVVTITDGTQTVELRAPNTYTCSTGCEDGTVNITNSLGTTLYSKTVASGETATQQVADQTAEGTTGAGTITFPANTTGTIPDVDYTDSDGSAASVPYGTSLVCTPSKDLPDYTNQELEDGLSEAQRNALTRVSLFKAGTPAVTYYANDAGANNPGRGTDFFTLPVNNPNGNTNRFEVLGTDVVIDWAYRKYWTRYIQSPARIVWEPHNDAAAALTLEGLSTWRLPLIMEYLTIMNTWDGDPLDYSPFNIANGTTPGAQYNFATGQTSLNNTSRYWSVILRTASRGYNFSDSLNKTTNGAVALYCKDF